MSPAAATMNPVNPDAPVWWNRLVKKILDLSIPEELTMTLLRIAEMLDWPSMTDPSRNAKAWTGVVSLPVLGSRLGKSRKTAQRRMRMIEHCGLVQRAPQLVDLHKYKLPWSCKLDVALIEQLAALPAKVWRDGSHEVAFALSQWTPSTLREEQGPESKKRKHERAAQSDVSEVVVNVRVDAIIDALPVYWQAKSGATLTRLRSVARRSLRDGVDDATWRQQVADLVWGIEQVGAIWDGTLTLSAAATNKLQTVAKGLLAGRRIWHPATFADRAAECRAARDLVAGTFAPQLIGAAGSGELDTALDAVAAVDQDLVDQLETYNGYGHVVVKLPSATSARRFAALAAPHFAAHGVLALIEGPPAT